MDTTATKEVRKLLGSRFQGLESVSLRLEKLITVEERNKGREVNAVVDCHRKHAEAPSYRYRQLPGARFRILRLGGRLIVNQAGGVLENAGLCLHRNFGCPMIPGSAVKGVARHAAWSRWKEASDDGDEREARALAAKIAATFGYPTMDRGLDDYIGETFEWGRNRYAGTVSFLPALPAGKASLVADIVTCHHPKYYARNDGKALDNEDPNPQPFPAVEAETAFEFVVVPLRRAEAGLPASLPDFSPVDFALDSIVEGLEWFGAGAKTAAGYGWFERDQATEEQVSAEDQKPDLEPDPELLASFGEKGESELRGLVNKYNSPRQDFWPEDDVFQLSLLHYCTDVKAELGEEFRKGRKTGKALRNLAEKFDRRLP